MNVKAVTRYLFMNIIVYSVVYFGQQRGTHLVRSIEYYIIIINLLLFSSKNRCTVTVGHQLLSTAILVNFSVLLSS